MLKSEIGNELSVSTAQDTALGQLLLAGQRDLADRFDWPHLHSRVRVGVDALAQYVNLPAELNFDRPVRVSVLDGSLWREIGYGIGDSELNTHDYADGETSDPIQRWNRYGASQFEVWPVGAVAQVLRFDGQQRIADLSATQPATLDDLLLVYWVAAKYLTRVKSTQAALAIGQFNDRMSQLRRNAPRRSGFYVLGGRIPRYNKSRVISVAGGVGAGSGTVDTSPFFGSDAQLFGSDEQGFGDS